MRHISSHELAAVSAPAAAPKPASTHRHRVRARRRLGPAIKALIFAALVGLGAGLLATLAIE